MITRDSYPTLFDSIDETEFENAQQQLQNLSIKRLTDWTIQHTVTYELGSQRYRMVVDRGDSDAVIIAGGEYGVGLDSVGSAARLLTIRALVDEHATVVLQPNSSLHEDNTNFSRDERKKLVAGDTAPFVDRLRLTLDDIHAQKIIGYGPSQGGTSILALGAHLQMPPLATAVVEVPNVERRSGLRLTYDFLGAGSLLKRNIRENFEPDSELAAALVGGMSLRGTVRYLAGLVHADNLASIGIMRRYTAPRQMKAILDKGGSVCHAWATETSVSPVERNRSIKVIFGANAYDGRYFPFEINENDHSVTNQYLLNAALVRRASDLVIS